jgi:hypothetical protein
MLKIKKGLDFEIYTSLIQAHHTINEIPVFGAGHPSSNVDLIQCRQNNTMLVNVINPTEEPERMTAPIFIRSIIGLYRLDISPDIAAKAFENAFEFRTPIDIDREGSEPVLFDGERPRHVVKSGAKTVSPFANQKPPIDRKGLNEIGPEDIAAIMRVYIDRASVGITFEESPHFSIEDIKVFLRPVNTSEGFSHLLHELQYHL